MLDSLVVVDHILMKFNMEIVVYLIKEVLITEAVLLALALILEMAMRVKVKITLRVIL